MIIRKYDTDWPADATPLEIELAMIRLLHNQPGVENHYLAAHKLLWPEDQQHRWFILGLKTIVANKVSVMLGCASSSKTYIMAVHALIDFFAFPHTSLALVSSTDIRSLELKVWGRFKSLFNRARARHPHLPGFALDTKMTITPDDIDEENEIARELNKGIVCVPCVSGGRFIGMGKFQGAKPPHSPGKTDGILKHYGDEAAVMQNSFLDAYTNWTVSPGFKGVMCGNPTDISDSLCIAAEPEGGWDAFVDDGKTQEWNSKWYNARVVAFDGRDSPNNDEPKNRYPFLVSADWVAAMKQTHGEDSWQFFQQAIGKPSRGMVSNRVITIGLCERNQAFDPPVWKDSTFTDIYAVDPAYGGGDRCVAGKIRIGASVEGKQIIEVPMPEVLPIRLNSPLEPEEQIAEMVYSRMRDLEIPAQNGFYDAFGRGTLGFAFAKLFGAACPVPVDAGARPTPRPVRFDLFINDNGTQRLKRCDEHYSKFITEMWFSTREAIESGQIRNLPRAVANEGQLRLFSIVAGNKVEVESKDDMKERVKKSPDLYDWFAIAIEGARQRNFKIQRLGQTVEVKRKPDWLDKHLTGLKELSRSKQLEVH